jgi:SAM-dependent methyltransferase
VTVTATLVLHSSAPGHFACYGSSVMNPVSAVSQKLACEWPGYISTDFSFTDYQAGARVLDVGFGGGEQMRRLQARGCRAFGIEYDPPLASRGGASGLAVCRAAAEQLPIRSGSLDGLICKVVIPYTDEARAVAEIARVLRAGGTARLSYHGLGYSLRYLLGDPDWKRRVYGLRTIVNTLVYRTTGRRLPGFWGDTVYQGSRRLQRYYATAGLTLVSEQRAATFAGAPVFIYHVVRKAGA